MDDLLVWGEDFEAIFGVLEDDEGEEQFSFAVRNFALLSLCLPQMGFSTRVKQTKLN